MWSPRTVVFMWPHGAAKSVIASTYLNRLSAERGLNVRATAAQAALARQAKVTAEQARSAALVAVPSTAQGVRLDRDEGRMVYEVRVQPQAGAAPQDVTVDAISGRVLKTEPAREREGDGDD
jgi:uncharacterized membrane protein YkoI